MSSKKTTTTVEKKSKNIVKPITNEMNSNLFSDSFNVKPINVKRKKKVIYKNYKSPLVDKKKIFI